MKQISDILKNFNPTEDKYISREFQSYGMYLTETLNDYKHKALYMKLAKTVHRSILEKALSYVKDAKVERPGALFMWRLKQLRTEAAQMATPGGKLYQVKEKKKTS